MKSYITPFLIYLFISYSFIKVIKVLFSFYFILEYLSAVIFLIICLTFLNMLRIYFFKDDIKSDFCGNKPILIYKMEKNQKYEIKDFIADLKLLQNLNTKALLILFLTFPLLWGSYILQFLIYLNFLIWYSSKIITAFLTKEIITYANIIDTESFYFKWYEIIIIYFIDYPKLQAFFVIYFLLNKKLKQKELSLILNKLAIAKISGFSLNFIVKIYWSYKIYNVVLQKINWQEKYKAWYPIIFIEEAKEKYSMYINYSLNPAYHCVKTLKIIPNKMILNPKYTNIINFGDTIQMHNFLKEIIKAHRSNFIKMLELKPDNILDTSLWINIQNTIFSRKPHLTALALSNPTKLEQIHENKKAILGDIFSHSKRLKTTEGEILGNTIKQWINPATGEPLPPEATYTYFSAIDNKVISEFKTLRILNDYKIKTFQDLILFRFFEDLKMSKFLDKPSNILYQDTKNKKILSLVSLIDENKLHKNCIAYVFENAVKYNKSINNIIENHIEKYKIKIQKLHKDFLNSPLTQDKRAVSEEILETEKIIKNINISKEGIIQELTKNFYNQLKHESIPSLLDSGNNILYEDGIEGLNNYFILEKYEQ